MTQNIQQKKSNLSLFWEVLNLEKKPNYHIIRYVMKKFYNSHKNLISLFELFFLFFFINLWFDSLIGCKYNESRNKCSKLTI